MQRKSTEPTWSRQLADYVYVTKNGEVFHFGIGGLSELPVTITTRGYPQVSVWRDCKCHKASVHRLVAMAWCDGYAPERQVNHINGVKTDNRASNLEWVTPGENNRHAFSSGLRVPARGDNHHWARMSEEKVREIRSNPSMSTEEKHRLAAKHGVTIGTIYRVLNNKSWKWVKQTSARR